MRCALENYFRDEEALWEELSFLVTSAYKL